MLPAKGVHLLVVLLLATLLLSAGTAMSAESGELFLPSDDVMADVSRAMDSARTNDRLVLVVMGANWCHDSRALASRLYQEPLRSLIEDRYETVFVDVGYLDKGSEVISSIGPPVYYATPTVLIVDPVSGQLVNSGNRHQWGSADTISMGESVDYFQLMAETDLAAMRAEQQPTGELLNEIDGFEQAQAERLYSAYQIIGPMLKAYKEGDPPEQFEEYWNEVRDFRMQVALDVEALRSEAYQRVSAGENDIQLDYPEYMSFSWE
jgi:hypothetical protein